MKEPIDRLAELVANNAALVDPLDCRGGERYMISTYEEHVFELRVEHVAGLGEAYKAYEALKDKANNDYSDDELLCEAVKQQFPGLKERPASSLEFILFCEKIDAPLGANAFYSKITWWDKRARKTLEAIPLDAAL